MSQKSYSEDQVKDITEREKQGLEALKALNLTPAAVVEKVNIGKDCFVDKVTPFLSDTKYSEVISPIQKEDIAKNDEDTPKTA